jgi:hypothetical protein
MTKDSSQDAPIVTGDPILLSVLATAQRFAAWYAEYLSAGVAAPAPAYSDTLDERLAERRAEDLVRHLQHAVFDLMAAVHEMNRLCAGQSQARDQRSAPPLALARTALH